MIAKERQEKIINILQQESTVRIDKLCDIFSVTSETIRRDLAILEDSQLLRKVHGGAVLPFSPIIQESSFNERYKLNLQKKVTIAKLAASYINEREIVMLDASSSAYCLSELILNKETIVIISNSLKILERVSYGGAKVVGIGGELDKSLSAFIGSQTENSLENYYATHCFISCHGLDMNFGMMDISSAETSIKESMLAHATFKYLLIDSSKFNQKAVFRINNLEFIDYFITDEKPSREWIEFFEKLPGTLIYPDLGINE